MANDLEQLETDGLLGSLVGLREDGRLEVSLTTRPLPSTARERLTAELWLRLRVWGQETSVCGAPPLNSYEFEEDVWAVSETINTTRKKWYKVLTIPPYTSTEVNSLEWVVTTTAKPPGFHHHLAASGDEPPPPVTCDLDIEGDKPVGWDGEDLGDPPTDYQWGSEVQPQNEDDRVDNGIITGSALATAAQGAEVLLYDSDWGLGKAYARLWFDGSTLGVLSGYSARSFAGDVRRVTIDLELRGWKVATQLKWEEVTIVLGSSDPATTVERSQWLEIGAWTHSIELGYPSYKHQTFITNLRVVPV